NVQLPPAIDAVVRRALAKRADDRFPTAQAFADALHAAMPAPMHGAADPDATMPSGVSVAPAAAVPPPPPPPPTSSTQAAAGSAAAPRPLATPAPEPAKPSQTVAILFVAGIAVVGLVALAATWWLWPRGAANSAAVVAQAAPTAATAPAGGGGAAPAASRGSTATPAADSTPPAAAAKPDGAIAAATPREAAAVEPPPGNLVISAVGLADPSDPRYANDKTLLQSDVRADSKQQLVEKALVMLLDRQSFEANYDVLKSRVVSKSGDFIGTIVREGEPQLGKDGLMSVTTQAVVDVKAVQQSLNQLSRDERVTLIRANGDPRVAVR